MIIMMMMMISRMLMFNLKPRYVLGTASPGRMLSGYSPDNQVRFLSLISIGRFLMIYCCLLKDAVKNSSEFNVGADVSPAGDSKVNGEMIAANSSNAVY